MDKLNWIFSGLLVLIGAGGVIAAINTLREIREQTKATKQSVDVLINSERAWIVVSRVAPPDKHGWYAPDEPQYWPGMAFEFEVSGKTVARITDARFNLLPVVTKPHVTPLEPSLPAIPDYTNRGRSQEITEDGRVVVPGQKFQIMVGLPQPLSESEWVSLRDGLTIMCAYGFIKYESLGRQHETAICYVYRFHFGGVITSTDGVRLNPSGFELYGPPAYNRSS